MTLKSILIFGAGLVTGAIGGYFLTKEALKTKNQAEIQDMREYYMELYGHKTKNDDGKDKNYDKYGTNIVTVGKNGLEAKDKVEVVMQNYQTESKLIAEGRDQDKKALKSTFAKPYEITEEEWEQGDYEKIEYAWYYQKQTMIYEKVVDRLVENVVIPDPYVQVGADNLTTLEESADGYIYVRNDNLRMDYFIELESGDPPMDEEPYVDTDDDDEVY